MPCMITGASDGMAPAWLATSSAPPSAGIFSSPSHSTRNQLRYIGSYSAPGDLPHVLGAAPLVDVGPTGLGSLLRLGLRGGDRDQGPAGGQRTRRGGVLPTLVPSRSSSSIADMLRNSPGAGLRSSVDRSGSGEGPAPGAGVPSPPMADTRPPRPLDALRERDFRWFWIGASSPTPAGGCRTPPFPTWCSSSRAAPATVGLTGFFQYLPFMVMGIARGQRSPTATPAARS